MSTDDRMTAVYAAVPAKLSNPWAKGGVYRYDRKLLTDLIAVQVAAGSAQVSATGGLAIAVDIWVATEFRRAGLEPDVVWPRAARPRSVSQDLTRGVRAFKFARNGAERAIEEAAIAQLVDRAGSARSNILGGYFQKEIDVVVAAEDRGLELGVSTKSMTGSFGKNLGNRFEEAAGDLANIRRRYPMATLATAISRPPTSSTSRRRGSGSRTCCASCARSPRATRRPVKTPPLAEREGAPRRQERSR